MLVGRVRDSCCGLLACLAVVLAAWSARAEAPVELRESACREAPLEQVLPALRVELREQLDEGSSAPRAYRLYAQCEDDVLTVRVIAPDGQEQAFETRLKGTSDDVRARVVALAIAEIARDLPELSEPPPLPAAPPPAPPAPPPGAREDAPAEAGEERSGRLAAFAQGSMFAANGTWLAGAGLDASYRLGALALGLDAALLTRGREVELGKARAFVTYAEPTLAYLLSLQHVELRAGAAFALGLTRLDGRARGMGSGEASLNRAFLAPSLFALASTQLTRRVALFIKLQLGVPLLTAIGQVPDAEDLQIRGAWTSLMLGASHAFGRPSSLSRARR
jgi:hypothetical protein